MYNNTKCFKRIQKNFVHLLILFFICFSSTGMGSNKMLKIEFSNLAQVLLWEETPTAFSSGGLKIYTGKEKIDSGERWLDILVKFNTEINPLDKTNLIVKVRDISEKPLLEVKNPVSAPSALVRLDMRSLKIEGAFLHIEWRGANNKLLGVSEVWVSSEPIKPLASTTKIPVKLDIPDGINSVEKYPVTFGLPLPRGAAWDEAGFKVVDLKGKEIPSQFEVAGRWAEEGSIKWLWVDTLVSGKTGDHVFVEPAKDKSSTLLSPTLKVEKNKEEYRVNTGVAEYVVGKDGALLKEIRLNGKVIEKEGKFRGLYLIDQKNRLSNASAKDSIIKLESKGPVSSVIKIEGVYRTAEGEETARHITRFKFSAGRPETELVHTLLLTRDTNEIWFKDVGWEFEVLPGTNPNALLGLFSEKDEYSVGKVDYEPGGSGGASNPKTERQKIEKKDIEKKFSVSLSGKEVVSVLQKEGVSLGLKPINIPRWNREKNYVSAWYPQLHGKDSFEVTEKNSGKSLLKGDKIGDWTALVGANGGFLLSCKDTASQHPKEIEIAGDRFNFKLFSSQAGKELDFRMESLMKNWGMLPIEKVESYKEIPHERLEKYLTFVAKHKSNAVGWAKTHSILISPIGSNSDPAEISFLHSKEVFAHIDPFWIRETKALGPFYPKDREKYPNEENLINNLFWGKIVNGLGGPIGGFIDYNAGPHWIIHSWRSGSYTIRSDSWYLYARSSDRWIREFAQGANRAFLDNNIAHWKSSNKIPGLLLGGSGGPGTLAERTRKADLPLYWETDANNYEEATVVNYDQLLLDYYITGSRRAGDIMSNFAQAIKENLKVSKNHWRVILAVRHIAQAYEFSWDPRLKELIYEIIDQHIYDPESSVLLSKARPHRSSTYKMETDGDVFVELYNLFGDRLFYNMAKAIAEYNWDKEAINPPKSPHQNRSTGIMGYFLWEETRLPSVVARFDYGRRRLVGDRLTNVAEGKMRLTCVSQIPRYFKGLPMAMDVLERTKDDEKSSYISFGVDTPSIKVFFKKPGEIKSPGHYAPMGKDETSTEIILKKEESASVEHFKGREENGIKKPWVIGNSVILKPHTVLRYIWMGHDLHSIEEKSFGVTKIRIPKDAPGGDYELEIVNSGEYSIFTDKHIPLALYAPEGWKPPIMNPPAKVFFNVPEGTEKGRIFFERETNLFTPAGELYEKGVEAFGWVEIPKDKPGLWSFESINPGKVKVEKMPTFFSMESPDFYMEHKQ